LAPFDLCPSDASFEIQAAPTASTGSWPNLDFRYFSTGRDWPIAMALALTFRLLVGPGGSDGGRYGRLFPRLRMSGRAVAPLGPTAEQPGERSLPMAMAGTVKFFNAERGYGFIKPDDGGRDVFVHVTAVERAGLKSLTEGQRISFDVEPDKKGKGPKAVNLVITG
jgi:CspA family cold shock protein